MVDISEVVVKTRDASASVMVFEKGERSRSLLCPEVSFCLFRPSEKDSQLTHRHFFQNLTKVPWLMFALLIRCRFKVHIGSGREGGREALRGQTVG